LHIFLLLLLFVNIWVLWIDVLSSVSFLIQHQVSPWCKNRQMKRRKVSTLVHSRDIVTKSKELWWHLSWRSLVSYVLINHCIILFEIMLISENKFNTVCFFYCFAEHTSCDKILWWMQHFCVIEPPCSERQQKLDPIMYSLSQPLKLS
jgi:hypothetical protein